MEKSETVIAALSERLEGHDDNRRAVQEALHNGCNELRRQIDEMEVTISRRLEEEYTKEDNRLQNALGELRECIDVEEGYENTENLSKALQKAVTELLVMQNYKLVECDPKDKEEDIPKRFELKVDKVVVPEWTCLKKPLIKDVTNYDTEKIYIEVDKILPQGTSTKDNFSSDLFTYKGLVYKEDREGDGDEFALTKEENEIKDKFAVFSGTLESETTYKVKVKVACNGNESEWSDAFEFSTAGFSLCSWSECLSYVDDRMKYFIDYANPMIATKSHFGDNCTIIGNTPLPLNKVTLWSVRILKSKDNDGGGICVGVAPSYIDQNYKDNASNCGWYLDCFESSLLSGPPQNYDYKAYGPRKGYGEYVHTGDCVGVVMDTAKGELSFVLNGVNLGVAYEGIPLDEPLVPCVILCYKGDSVELVI